MVMLRFRELARPATGVLLRAGRLLLLLAFLALPLAAPPPAVSAAAPCQLYAPKGNIQHVIALTFDNVHFTRDNPNIPSDLEQMPHLLNFITSNGVLLTNNHTPLISHTATDILTTLTGVYGDRHGVPVSNSFRYFNPNGTTNSGVSFAYWTAPIFDPTTSTPSDTKYNMLTENGKNAPAPWAPFTRAGCDFGGVATANMVLENSALDVSTVFGPGSPEAQEVSANPAQGFADFVGIGIHCAQGSPLCAGNANARADVLPDEPGGYIGFSGLFGAKYVAQAIHPSGPVTDINGSVIQDPSGHVGFPGFDGMSAAVTLGYVAAMQEAGVPVTYAYISDAHDKHPSGPAYGPGEAGYVAALQAYDQAFAAFFTRLAADGITAQNTLFVVSADENDHFAGGAPSPANCDGVNIPCTYSLIGEANANLTGLLATQQGITTPFRVHSDSAPTIYITGNLAPNAPLTRAFERAAARITATNPFTGNTDVLAQYLADPTEMQILHMVTADPARTPTFTFFGNPDYFFFTGAANCSTPCVTVQPGFAWNHGDVSPDITRTWLGLVGPGVANLGIDSTTWADHTDIRPTVLDLVGLKDSYRHDGRVLVEDLNGNAVSAAVKKNGAFRKIAAAYKQLNAPLGQFALASLQAATHGLSSGSTADDSVYAATQAQLASLGSQRDALALQMVTLLEGAAFHNQPISEATAQDLVSQASALIAQMQALAGQ